MGREGKNHAHGAQLKAWLPEWCQGALGARVRKVDLSHRQRGPLKIFQNESHRRSDALGR